MPTPSTSTDLRVWLARLLRRPSVPDWLWAELSESGVLRDGDAPGNRAEIVREARRRLRAIRGGTGHPRKAATGSPRVTRLLSKGEERRALAFSEYVATLARQNREVPRFRSRLLDGQLLSREEAIELLRSEAPRYMARDDFLREGIPLVKRGMHAQFELKTGPAPCPEGSTATSPPNWRHEVDLTIRWDTGSRALHLTRDYPPAGAQPEDEPTVYLTADGESWVPQRVWRDSVFHELGELSDRLARSYPWLQEQATMFILTGEAPFISPIRFDPADWRIGSYAYARFTLYVEPWVSTESVARLFRHLQKGTLGKRSRAISDKHLTLLEFVTRYSQSGDQVPSFESLVHLWNKAHPKWKYKSAWRFARDYRRVGQNVVQPPYTIFQPSKPASARKAGAEGR